MKARIEDGVVYSPYPSVDVPVCSFYALAKEMLLLKPDRIALVDGVTSITSAEMLSRMQRYAVGFRRNGVVPGDRICTHLKNTMENLLAMYGCILAGATVVLAKTSLTESELRYQADDSDSTHVLTDSEHAEKVTRAVTSLPMKGLFCMGRTTGFVSASAFTQLDEKEYEEIPIDDPKSVVLAVCYTSGTTGKAKGAEMTHYNYVACFYTTRFILPIGEDDVFLALNPITHQSGMLYAFIVLLVGATNIITPVNISSTDVMNTIDKHKVSGVHMTPSRLQALVAEMRRTGRRLPTMKAIVITGSVLTTSATHAAREAFEGLDCLLNMYGMTESCSVITSQSRCDGTSTGADTGVPNTTAMLKVVDVLTGQKLGPPPDRGSLLPRGDVGYYDEDGRLYIVDRLKELIKCMDNQVVPAEVEELLLREHSADIAEVSVVGLPHSQYGEAPVAAIVLTKEGCKKNRELLAKNIKTSVEKHLAVHKHLHGGVFFVDSLPRTDTGKVDRPALKHILATA
ncbi:hypothetical protein MTO96_020317 [Rhipicephalus appendiculatus]